MIAHLVVIQPTLFWSVNIYPSTVGTAQGLRNLHQFAKHRFHVVDAIVPGSNKVGEGVDGIFVTLYL